MKILLKLLVLVSQTLELIYILGPLHPLLHFEDYLAHQANQSILFRFDALHWRLHFFLLLPSDSNSILATLLKVLTLNQPHLL